MSMNGNEGFIHKWSYCVHVEQRATSRVTRTTHASAGSGELKSLSRIEELLHVLCHRPRILVSPVCA